MADGPKKLRKLVVDRVDLVDRGSNPDSDIVLFKREKDAPVIKLDFNEYMDMMAFHDAISKVSQMCYVLCDAIQSSAYGNRADAEKDIKRSIKQFSQKVDDVLGVLSKTELEKSAASAIRKSVDEFLSQIEITEENTPMKIDKSKLTAEEVAHLEDLEKRAASVPAPEANPEDILKTVPAEVRKMVEDAQAIAKKAQEDVAAAIAKADEAEAKRAFAEITKRVETEYPSMPGTAEEKATAVQKAEATGNAHLLAMLRAGEAAMAKALASGTQSETPGASGSGAFQKLEAKAAEIRKAEPKLSEQQAFTKAVQQNPELYKQYKNGE